MDLDNNLGLFAPDAFEHPLPIFHQGITKGFDKIVNAAKEALSTNQPILDILNRSKITAKDLEELPQKLTNDDIANKVCRWLRFIVAYGEASDKLEKSLTISNEQWKGIEEGDFDFSLDSYLETIACLKDWVSLYNEFFDHEDSKSLINHDIIQSIASSTELLYLDLLDFIDVYREALIPEIGEVKASNNPERAKYLKDLLSKAMQAADLLESCKIEEPKRNHWWQGFNPFSKELQTHSYEKQLALSSQRLVKAHNDFMVFCQGQLSQYEKLSEGTSKLTQEEYQELVSKKAYTTAGKRRLADAQYRSRPEREMPDWQKKALGLFFLAIQAGQALKPVRIPTSDEQSLSRPPKTKKVNAQTDTCSFNPAQEALLSSSSEEPDRKLTFLHMADTHSHVDQYESMINYISKVVEDNDSVTVFHAGDFVQGTSFFELFKGKLDTLFMNMANVTAACPGNHEWDIRHDKCNNATHCLQDLVKESSFTMVNANVIPDGETAPLFTSRILREIEGVKFGITGIIGQGAWGIIDIRKKLGLDIISPTDALDRLAQDKEFMSADNLIVLSHSGVEEDKVIGNHPIFDRVPGLVIGGHDHKFAERCDHSSKAPICYSGCHGKAVGRIDLTCPKGQSCHVESSSLQHMDTGKKDTDSKVAKILEPYREEEKKHFSTKLGTCIQNCPSPKADKRERLIPLGQTITELMRKIAGTDIAFIPGGTIRSDHGFEIGDFTRRVWHYVLSHDDPLWSGTVNGTSLMNIMRVKRWGIKSKEPFQYSGIEVIQRDSQDQKVLVNGKEVDPQKNYTVATIPYLFYFLNPELKEKKPNEDTLLFHNVTEVHHDIRDAAEKFITTEGFGPWVRGINQNDKNC